MGSEHRPDPDALLKQVQQEDTEEKRGRLKIFFGAAPGVGKTYAMLEAAHRLKKEGIDVVVGYVDTHGRKETHGLLAGLPLLPPRLVEYKKTQLREFDLDAALKRKPQVILVDELAHSNPFDARHPKRWQDVMELLEAGIDVYTTLNVQHIESLNDVVAQITYVQVQETIPDAVLERADEIELIDLPPDELLDRLKEGKVYIPEQAQQALQNFFRKGNLLALRELALRSTAQRVDVDVRAYRRAHGIATTWHTTERILVCLPPSIFAERLVRTAKRMASTMQAPWTVLYIESSQHEHLSERQQNDLQHGLQLAESLGAEVVVTQHLNLSEGILQYARDHNFTKIILGKSTRSRFRERLFGSLVDSVIRDSGPIDVFVVTGEEEAPPVEKSQNLAKPAFRYRAWPYISALISVVVATGIGTLFWRQFKMTEDVIMIYFLSIVWVATRYGRGPSIAAVLWSVLVFDLFFIPPYFRLSVVDARYLLTFVTMITIGIVVSQLTHRVRWQAQSARKREQRTAALYRLSQKLGQAQNKQQLAQLAAGHLMDVFHTKVVLGVRTPASPSMQTPVTIPHPLLWLIPFSEETWQVREQGIADWVFHHGRAAGLGTDTLPASQALYLPLQITSRCIGVLGLRPQQDGGLHEVETRQLLQAFCDQIALGLERCSLLEASQQAALRTEKDQLRSTLLRAVSHDLRTPLTVITGAASSLLENLHTPLAIGQKELLQTIVHEGEHLNRLIRNLLDMTRLDSGGLALQKEWIPIEEIVESALRHLAPRLQNHPIHVDVPKETTLVPMDGGLIEQVLTNLLENVVNHTPVGTSIDIRARSSPDLLNVIVADRGPGLPAGQETLVFEPFFRGQSRADGGVGLGLAICKGIVEAHGGMISAMNRRGGGAAFAFTLPIQGKPPLVESREDKILPAARSYHDDLS